MVCSSIRRRMDAPIARRRIAALSLLAGLASGSGFSTGAPDAPQATYCIPLKFLSLSPYEELGEPVRLFYLLLLTRSYISTDPTEPGLLSNWQFSPDGLRLTARVAPNAKWQDGTPITGRDAAYSLAKAIRFKPIGQKVWVKGTESMIKPDWESRTYSGIKLTGTDGFELTFESKVSNTAGIIREALATNARHNRLWAARLHHKDAGGKTEIATKFPYSWSGQNILVDAGGTTVSITADRDCNKSDFKIYSVPEAEDKLFSRSKTNGQQAFVGVVNPKGQLRERSVRLQLAQWLRGAFRQQEQKGFQVLSSHFARLETGHTDAIEWGTSLTAPSLSSLLITKGTNYPTNSPIEQTLGHALKDSKIRGSIVPFVEGTPAKDYEIRIAGTRIEGDRQIWMQDWGNDDFFKDLFSHYPRTFAALNEVVKRSSSTIPTDQATLAALDSAAFDEASVIPLARYRLNVYSRLSLPIYLSFTDKDELTIKRRQ